MPVDFIFRRVGQKIGLRPDVADDRIIISDYVNQAALELYEELQDIPDMLKEVTVDVSANTTIALPNDVAYIRAIRESDNINRQFQWNLRDTYQKYQDGVIDQAMWTSWNIKKRTALNTEDFTAGQVTLTIPTADSTIVTVVGATANASRLAEAVTMNGVTKTTVATFTSIDEIYKNDTNNYDITVKDGGLATVAVIPNNQLESKYLLVDVSQYPTNLATIVSMDVLYKMKLPRLEDDTDTFPAWGYDNILIDKAVQIWAEDNNNPEEGILRDKKINRSLRRKESNHSKGQNKTAQFTFNIPDVNTRHLEPLAWRRLRRG